MPIYEYVCTTCETKFDELVRDAQALTARCPKCGTSEVNRLLSVFATSNSTAGAPSDFSASSSGHCCGGACGCRNN